MDFNLTFFTAVIEEVGYVNFLEIAGPQNLMGGWPMVQSNWDESKFSAFKVRISNSKFEHLVNQICMGYKQIIHEIFFVSHFVNEFKRNFSMTE